MWQVLFIFLGMASDSYHFYPGQNIAEQDKNIADILKNVELIQTVVMAHHPWLKALLGNTAAPK